jgi:hypothetical protein
MPSGLRAELAAASAHHRAVEVAYARRRDVPPGKPLTPFDPEAFDAYLAELLPARDRLNVALAAALPLAEPVQLDMFAEASA